MERIIGALINQNICMAWPDYAVRNRQARYRRSPRSKGLLRNMEIQTHMRSRLFSPGGRYFSAVGIWDCGVRGGLDRTAA